QFRPSRSRYKVYIIDEVHMLSTSAFNALLKTLEEPPPHVKFIFATTVVQKVPITVLSRCQRFDFAGIPSKQITERLRAVVSGGVDVIGLNSSPRLRDIVVQDAAAVSLDTVLAGLDVLQSTRTRLRGSGHGRVLLEMALVRLSRLDDLVSLSQLAQLLQGGDGPASPPAPRAPNPSVQVATRFAELADGAKKKSADLTDAPVATLTAETIPQIWAEVLAQVGPILARELDRGGLPAITGPNRLALHFSAEYNQQREQCSDPVRL